MGTDQLTPEKHGVAGDAKLTSTMIALAVGRSPITVSMTYSASSMSVTNYRQGQALCVEQLCANTLPAAVRQRSCLFNLDAL